MLAISTLNTLPKFELAVILMYLMILAKVLRPSMTASSSTSKLFSSRMMSAELLGNIDGGIHRNSNVRVLERRRVVDAVAQDSRLYGLCS